MKTAVKTIHHPIISEIASGVTVAGFTPTTEKRIFIILYKIDFMPFFMFTLTISEVIYA
ncbi:hypothetical protein [Bacillus pakistanensis]|uniref:hypothetical protein n=1 Tax=Rossellomorea pakistanensis TaxID=992288 RepID=UPI0019624D14|nr:hypothetical protein [Bacillus pakistanensis]